ncbi:MAG TPA: alginate export family protein [Steroidobacteraceae bacterium]|nr:alginate export family protein [Steroidobacteraceae bacterium]
MRIHFFQITLMLPAAAYADETQSLSQALLATTPLIDVRLRHEEVEQTGLPSNADANTLRLRVGAQTGRFLDTSLLVEGEVMLPFDRAYRPDNAVSSYTQFPVVADPRNLVVNRAQLVNKTLPKTTLTVGRQRIILDDQRFVGNSGWRQNEVTFDAVRIVNQSLPNFTIDLTALDRVNRIYGHDSPQGTYKGDSYLINAGYVLPIGTLTAFTYLLDFDPISGLAGALDPRRGSTSTTGGRLGGTWPVSDVRLGYTVSYASQTPRADNPLEFHNNYFLAEIKASVAGVTLTLGDETLHGNGTVGFATPLATLHLFQGWADKFLTTPADGIDDRYATVNWTIKQVTCLDSLAVTAVYHDYDAERISIAYGKERDLLLVGKWHQYAATFKYADFTSAVATPLAIARDTEKFWAQIEYIL